MLHGDKLRSPEHFDRNIRENNAVFITSELMSSRRDRERERQRVIEISDHLISALHK